MLMKSDDCESVAKLPEELRAKRRPVGAIAIHYPKFARFMQPDPIGYEAGMNLYGYVSGDPVNFVDPTGEREVCWTVDTSYRTETRDVIQSRRVCVDIPGDAPGIIGDGGGIDGFELAGFSHPNLGPIFGDCVPAGSAGRHGITVLSDKAGGIQQAFQDLDYLAVINQAFTLGNHSELTALPFGWSNLGTPTNFRVREVMTGLQLRISGGVARIDIPAGTRVTYNRIAERSRGGEVVHYGRNICR